MFSLAATVALLFAGGIGAGTVLAYDRLAGSSQNTAASDSPASAAETLSGSAVSSGDLRPVLIMDGEVGYVYQGAFASADALAGAYIPRSDVTDQEVAAPLVPIYLADGVTLVGYYDPASLNRK